MRGPGLIDAAIKAEDFAGYPPHARQVAVEHLLLFRRLPPIFAAILLRDLIGYDWKFPAERAAMDRQLMLLGALTPQGLERQMAGFAAIAVNSDLQRSQIAGNPAAFMEQLTAWLWSSGQMDSFRVAAEEYGKYLATAAPVSRPARRRFGIVILGQGASTQTGAKDEYKLFRKLRPHGLYLSHVDPEDGVRVLVAAASERALAAGPRGSREGGYGHWYIDGGSAQSASGLTQVAYNDLQQPIDQLLQRIQRDIESGSTGPERLRSSMAQLRPEDIGLGGVNSDAVLDRFILSLLAEGSGTQIFATTFVQWAGRECLRRAQPETLLLRYAPRHEVQPMNVMLSNAKTTTLDPQGSLIDADMGAYYTWVNMNRLSGADEMSFLVWLEGQGQAVAIGPDLPQGTTSDDRLTMHQVVSLLS